MSWEWTAETRTGLDAYLAANGLFDGTPEIARIGDGHSNQTFQITSGAHRMILRRPPPPPLEKGSNDMLREARIIGALGGTGVPVTRVLAVGQEGELFDVPFYIMEYLPGLVITTDLPAGFVGEDATQAMGLAMVDAMAALHGVDWAALGLDDFGRPDGFNARHLRRIAGVLMRGQSAMPPEFAEAHAWLEANVPPESGATIIHNDLRLGNVMWSREAPVVLALLDWELATLGDPLMDLAYLVSSVPLAGVPQTPTQQLATAALTPGFPSSEALIARYVERTGRDPAHLAWHLAMVNWKLAVLYRFSRLRGVDSYFADPQQVPLFLGEAARHIG